MYRNFFAFMTLAGFIVIFNQIKFANATDIASESDKTDGSADAEGEVPEETPEETPENPAKPEETEGQTPPPSGSGSMIPGLGEETGAAAEGEAGKEGDSFWEKHKNKIMIGVAVVIGIIIVVVIIGFVRGKQ